MKAVFKPTPEVQWLTTLPGVGELLAVVIALEVGDVSRFHRPQSLASYSGLTPRVKASGGKVKYGRLRPDVEPVSEVGVFGGRQLDLREPGALSESARESVV